MAVVEQQVDDGARSAGAEEMSIEHRLRQLGQDPSLARRSNSLGSLADALSGPDGDLWAKINLFDAFGEDSLTIKGEANLVERISRAEIGRNITILLPLLWTWLAIGFGVDAYNRLLATGDVNDARLLGAPFIEQWASGFGGRTWITFKWVALVDAALIFLVVLISAVVSVDRKRLDVGIEQEREEKWSELREVLTFASVQLASKAYDTPARFNEELSRLWTKYEGVADQMRLASKELERSVSNSESYTSGLQAASDGLVGAGQSIAGAAGDLHGTIDGLKQDIVMLTQAATALGEDVNRLIGSHAEAAVQLHEGMGSTSDAAGALKRSAESMAAQVDETNTRFLALVRSEMSGRQDAADQLARAGALAGELAGSLDKSSRRFTEAAETLHETAAGLPAGLERATSQLVASVDQNHQAMAQLPASIAQGLEPLAGVAEQLESVGHGYRDAHSDLGEATDRIANFSAELRDATDALSGSMDRFTEAGDAVPNHLQDATRQLQEVAVSCDRIARALSDVERHAGDLGSAHPDDGGAKSGFFARFWSRK